MARGARACRRWRRPRIRRCSCADSSIARDGEFKACALNFALRHAGESAFKAVCHAEYRGFFHIGIVTRNQRNAIIQHGRSVMPDNFLDFSG